MASKKKAAGGKAGTAKKGDEGVYVKIAEKLISSDWESVYADLDAPAKKKLFAILDKKKEILKKRKAAEKKGTGQPKGNDKRASVKEQQQGRKVNYNFGSRKLTVLRPSKGVPDKKEQKRAVEGKLKLIKAHGYSGNFDESRQNIYLSQDGKYLLYYIAAVVVVFDYAANKQTFFTKHNDDVTTICVSPNKTWCASGQKDPKDEPGKGKDLPKVYVWNYTNMKQVALMDDVCWGKISRVQWSKKTNLLYCLCGDDDQTLKAWDPKDFGPKKKVETLIKQPTMRELIYGFEINENPAAENTDEFILFGKRKFAYCYITKSGKGLAAKIKAVSVVSLKKDGDKAYNCAQFLSDGNYAVGSSSGAIYIAKGNEALAILESAHDKAVGSMLMANDKLLTAGSDRKFKTFKVGKCEKGKSTGLEQDWECSVEVKESDVVMLPRAMAYNSSEGTVFCGTKTNQIVQFEMKSEDAKVIVDGHDGQIWALATSPNETLFATGGYDNAVKVWDAKTQKCIATYEFEKDDDNPKGHQFCSGHWSNKGDMLVFGTEQSNLAVFVWRNKELKFVSVINIPPKTDDAEIEAVSYLRFNNDASLLAAAHMDSNLYIYTITKAESEAPEFEQWPPMNHIAAPTNVQFTEDSKLVKTLTRDYEIAHWSLDAAAKKGKFVTSIPDPDTTKWADDPLIAGWDTQGLYQKGWDGTDLNDATVTSDNRLIASGDDYGCVRLHNYPAIEPEACLEYHGHAEFVVGVEFLRDDSQLITCGGSDQAIFQWQVIKSKK